MIKIEEIIKNKIKGISIILCSIFYSLMYSTYNMYKSLSKFSLYVTFIFMLTILLLEYKNILKEKKKSLILSLIIIGINIGEVIINSTGIGSIIIMANLLILFVVSGSVTFEKKHINICCLFFLIGHILFLISEKRFYNTNCFGYVSFAMLPFSMCFLLNNKNSNNIWKILKVIIAILIVIFTIKTVNESDSRGVLMGLVIFGIILFTKKKYLMNKRIFSIFTLLLMMGIIVFTFLYTYLWENNVEFKLPFSEKSLYSGREVIWKELIEQYGEHYLFGIGSNYNIQSFHQLNVHNSLLHILVIYGSIVFIIFVPLFYRLIKNTNNYLNNALYNKIFLASVIGMLLISFFETNLEWADVSIFFMLSVIFNYNNEKMLQ